MNAESSCRNLRSKNMFVSTVNQPDPDANPPSHSQHCWCNCTLTEVGPDDRPVGTNVCTPARLCFEK